MSETVIKNENGWEHIDVEFKGSVSKHSNCICTCCHNSAKVIYTRMPETLYHGGNSPLSTKWDTYWICFKCAEKLVNMLRQGLEAQQ